MTMCISVQEVRAILPEDTTLTDGQIEAAIGDAECTVEQIATGCASHLSSTCLARVTINLAAHYCAATEIELAIKSEKDCCGGSATYSTDAAAGFWRKANMLSGGCLAELDKPQAGLFSIGCH